MTGEGKKLKHMAKRKILITGSSGLVGGKLHEKASARYDVIGIARSHKQSVDIALDISDQDAFLRYLEHAQPDVIVHTAALTWVDYSEDHHEETDASNIRPVETIRDYCRAQKIQPHAIFISSDYVYDGKSEHAPFTEDSEAHPLNYYGLSKLQGEAIMQECQKNLILRPGVIFGWDQDGKNFFMQVWNALTQGKQMKVVDDQISNPTYVGTLVSVVLQAIDSGLTGLFVATGSESLDRFSFAKRIAEFFELDRSLLSPAKTSDFPSKAKRPMDCRTDPARLQLHLGFPFPHLEQNFMSIQEEMKKESVSIKHGTEK